MKLLAAEERATVVRPPTIHRPAAASRLIFRGAFSSGEKYFSSSNFAARENFPVKKIFVHFARRGREVLFRGENTAAAKINRA
jgi:hypothetical protein